MAVIVCFEVAQGAPVLYAVRTECLREVDSGWQFLCGDIHEDAKKAQVWAVHELLEQDPSLAPYIDYPVGTVLSRQSSDAEWDVSFE